MRDYEAINLLRNLQTKILWGKVPEFDSKGCGQLPEGYVILNRVINYLQDRAAKENIYYRKLIKLQEDSIGRLISALWSKGGKYIC